jgi:hypothetical protein
MSLNEQTPLEKVLASVPTTQPIYVRDMNRRTKIISGAFFQVGKPINKLQLLYIIHGVMTGELKPEDFELWTLEDGIFHIKPDGTCEKLKLWDYEKATWNIISEMNKLKIEQGGELDKLAGDQTI